MLIVKLMKYEATEPETAPSATAGIYIREASAVDVRYEANLRAVLRLEDLSGESLEVIIGSRPDCAYNVAYIMNASGKTVETIR